MSLFPGRVFASGSSSKECTRDARWRTLERLLRREHRWFFFFFFLVFSLLCILILLEFNSAVRAVQKDGGVWVFCS